MKNKKIRNKKKFEKCIISTDFDEIEGHGLENLHLYILTPKLSVFFKGHHIFKTYEEAEEFLTPLLCQHHMVNCSRCHNDIFSETKGFMGFGHCVFPCWGISEELFKEHSTKEKTPVITRKMKKILRSSLTIEEIAR